MFCILIIFIIFIFFIFFVYISPFVLRVIILLSSYLFMLFGFIVNLSFCLPQKLGSASFLSCSYLDYFSYLCGSFVIFLFQEFHHALLLSCNYLLCLYFLLLLFFHSFVFVHLSKSDYIIFFRNFVLHHYHLPNLYLEVILIYFIFYLLLFIRFLFHFEVFIYFQHHLIM